MNTDSKVELILKLLNSPYLITESLYFFLSLSRDKILDKYNLKVSVDVQLDILVEQITEFAVTQKKTFWKKHQHFLLFPKCFHKSSFHGR